MIDTLTDTDYVSVVDFSSSAVAYGDGLDELVPATADNLEAIQAWINGLRASGTTNFNDAFAKAWAIFRMSDTTGASSGCNKVRATASSRRPSSRPPPPPPRPPIAGGAVLCVRLSRPSFLLWQVLLFLTDGKPNGPWGDEQYAGVKRQAADSALTPQPQPQPQPQP